MMSLITPGKITQTTGDFYDLIIDVVGKHAVSRRIRLLKPGGFYFLAFAKPAHLIRLAWWTNR